MSLLQANKLDTVNIEELMVNYSSLLPRKKALSDLGKYRSTYEYGKSFVRYLPYGPLIESSANVGEALYTVLQ